MSAIQCFVYAENDAGCRLDTHMVSKLESGQLGVFTISLKKRTNASMYRLYNFFVFTRYFRKKNVLD